jgi:hypothetical protein
MEWMELAHGSGTIGVEASVSASTVSVELSKNTG